MLKPEEVTMLSPLTHALDSFFSVPTAFGPFFWDHNFFDVETAHHRVTPALNLYRDGEELVILSEIPGADKEDLIIEVKDNHLRIAGERVIDHGKDVNVLRAEHSSVKFDRTLKLPLKVDPEKVHAEYLNGVLTIRLGLSEADKPKKIEIS